jgi:phenylacetate-CoA ligase
MTTIASASNPSTHPDRLLALAGEQLARDRWSRDRLLAYRAELEAHLSGPAAGQPYLGRYRLFTTAGTTGVRGLFVEEAGEFAVWSATCLRGLASWGLRPATRLAGIGSPSPLHISSQAYAVLLAGQSRPAPALTVTTPLPELVAALNAFQPEALTAYPSVAAALAEEQLQGRLRIAPGLVATTSEVQTADMRRRCMAEAWGLEPLDFYGTTEALILAAGRPARRAWTSSRTW